MSIQPLSIHEVLTRPNPDPRILSPPGPVTNNMNYTSLRAQHIRPWADFTYENLMAAYGDLLQRGPIKAPVEEDISDSQKIVKTEANVDRLASKWTEEVLRYALKAGLSHRRGAPLNEKLETTISIDQHNIQIRDPVSNRLFKPDLCVFLQPSARLGEGFEVPILFGDNKCSTKLKSSYLSANTIGLLENIEWSFRQVASYGLWSGTRYTFIMTPEELIAVRLYRDERAYTQIRAEYQPVPWDNHGEGVLTVNLSIWWLAMMALDEMHRDLVPESRVLGLNVWHPLPANPGNGGGSSSTARYEHSLSRRRVRDLPVGQVSRPAPAAATSVQSPVPALRQVPDSDGSKRTRKR